MKESSEQYRAALPLVFFGLFVFGTIAAAAIMTALREAGYPLPGVRSASFLWLLSLLWVWLLICTPVIAWAYTISVDERGISGRTFWGRRRFLPWEDMNRVQKFGIYPFQFLRIRTNAGGPPMWVPLFLSNRRRWTQTVQAHVPDGHPVRDFI